MMLIAMPLLLACRPTVEPGPSEFPPTTPREDDTGTPRDTGEPPDTGTPEDTGTPPPLLEDEHPPEEEDIQLEWVWADVPVPGKDTVLDDPVIKAVLTNPTDSVQSLTLLVRGDEGDGIPQTPRDSFFDLILHPGEETSVEVDFGFLLSRETEHSGAVTLVVRRCPRDAPWECTTGALPPVYFHLDLNTGDTVVYDEDGLCARHNCGAYLSRDKPEDGTVRVVAGSPLARLAIDEGDPEVPPFDPTPDDIASNVRNYDVCLRTDVLISDAGWSPYAGGLTEDYWANAGDPGSFVVINRGYRARVLGPSLDTTIDSDPIDGCFTFQGFLDAEYDIVVYAYSTDTAGNVFRVHDAGTDTSSWYPGSTQSMMFANVELDPDGQNNLVIDGRLDDRWTTMAVGAYALYRFHDGASNRTISTSWGDSCGSSGSIHGDAEHYIESNNAHLLRIGRCADPATDTREKMLITHEMGHAMLRMHYGYDGDEQPRSQNWDPNSDPALNLADPGNGKRCYLTDDKGDPSPGSYSIHTVEFNSQAFKEGYADFWSARVWNLREEQAIYVYRSDVFDLETWDTFGLGLAGTGGFTSNWCEVTDPDDVSTKGDWTRFLWDVYTDPECKDTPTRLEMMDLYRDVRENHRTGDFELDIDTWDQGMMNAFEESSLDSCVKDRALIWANWNGI
ncbi:MAG: hypothetical protein KTR31_09810 [Myxococcales bacterium]|nr:hypothetical protein [Myxococcales bacterium]